MLWKVAGNTIRFATGRLRPSPGIHLSVVKFHEALHQGEPPPVPAEEGRRSIALLEEVVQRADAAKRQYLAERPPVRQPRILVTGAGGFLGRALVARLRESGEPLRLLLRRPPQVPPEDDVHLVYGDLGDPAAVDHAVHGVDVVYHVGAAMRGGNFEFSSGTIWGTRNIIEACERHAVKKLIYVSSMSVLDHAGHRSGLPVNESSPYEPHADRRGLYTQTKLEAERMVLEAVAQNRIQAVLLRPGQIYGPAAEKTPPSGTLAIAGRWLVVGSGERYVPFVYVENVVDALLLAAGKDVPNGTIFQLVDSGGIRQNEYIEWVRRSGRTPRVSHVPAWFLQCAAWGVELLGKLLKRPVPLTPYRVRSITPLWPCDCTAAHRQLGWQSRYTLQEGLARTFPPADRRERIK
jgi:nucleoside-diphosphate-sugar epimerase